MEHLGPRTGAVGASSYTAYDHGAQLAEWSVDGTPVVWLSEHAAYASGAVIQGGVPVCWPWFADGPEGGREPLHGFVRTAPWELLIHETGAERHRLAWRLTREQVSGQPGAEKFPHDFQLQVQVEVDAGVAVTLAVRNTDSVPWAFEAALHTFLHVGDVRQARVEGLDGVDYWDKVRQASATQSGPLVPEGETDRIYRAPAVVTVQDPVLDRTIGVTPSGSSDTVAWNPGAQRAPEFDLGSEWTQMLCVETAVIGERAMRLEPGQEHLLSTRVTLL